MVKTDLLRQCQQTAIASFCYQETDGQIYTLPRSQFCNFSNAFAQHTSGIKWIILCILLLIILPVIMAFAFYAVDWSGIAYNTILYGLIGIIGVIILLMSLQIRKTLKQCPKKWQDFFSVTPHSLFENSTLWRSSNP